jgi:hypothetical protein
LKVYISAFFSIIFTLFTASINLPEVSFLFFDITVVQLSLDCEKLRNRILLAEVSLNINIDNTFAEIENSLAIVLRTNFVFYISRVFAGHAVD